MLRALLVLCLMMPVHETRAQDAEVDADGAAPMAASDVSDLVERLMESILGRSPQEEIRHVQVNRIRELLLTTNLSAEKIASICGFEHPEYMHVVFKRITGQTTGQFRKRSKPRSSAALDPTAEPTKGKEADPSDKPSPDR